MPFTITGMENTLRWLTLISGVAIIGISLTHIALGQSWLPDTQTVTPSIDSQHRFYTALFLPYGVGLVWVSQHVRARLWALNIVLGALFLGGIARIVSFTIAGLPHRFFIGLWVAELVVPPIVHVSGRALSRQPVVDQVHM